MIDICQQRELGRQIMTVRGMTDIKKAGNADFREQMLLHNRIEGILPFEVVMEPEGKRYEYDIGEMSALSEFFDHNSPTREKLTVVLRSLLEIIYRGREYMLLEDDYIIGPGTVFIDEQCGVHIAYCPGYGTDLKAQLRDLAGYFMEKVDYTDEAAVMLIYGFYMRTKESGCTFDDLMKSLTPGINDNGILRTGLCGDNDHRIPGKQTFGHQTFVNQTFGQDIQPEKKDYLIQNNSAPEDDLMNGNIPGRGTEGENRTKPDLVRVFSESPAKLKLVGFLIPLISVLVIFIILKSGILLNVRTGRNDAVKTGLAVILVLGGCYEIEKLLWKGFSGKLSKSIAEAEKESDEATVVLYGNDAAGYPFSLVSDSQPPINVSHFPFFVGKDAKHCDYVMATQIGISRYHMKIDREGDDFTISDLNSTNGTFINGERLAPHLPHVIRRGDELRIGKCIYYCN